MQFAERLPLVSFRIEEGFVFARDIAKYMQKKFDENTEALVFNGIAGQYGEIIPATILADQDDQSNYSTVLLQVIESSVCTVNTYSFHENKSNVFLHELSVIGWSSDLNKDKVTGAGRIKFSRIYARPLYCILDSIFEVSAHHLSKDHHLGILLSYQQYENLIEESYLIDDRLQNSLSFGADVTRGLTEQEAHQNQAYFERYHQLLIKSYSFLDGCCISVDQVLQEESMKRVTKVGKTPTYPNKVDFNRDNEECYLHRYLNKQ